MNKNWYLVAAIVGGLATLPLAARHELGWTILGVICVGCNLYSYLNNLGE
jgi:hypothetical protein